MIGENRWAHERVAGLGPRERRVHAAILRGFVVRPAAPRELAADERALASLVRRDLVQLGSDGGVAVAYPFSAGPTRQRVRVADGRGWWAMCAIDALAIPWLLWRPAEIHANEPGSDRAVTVTLDPAAGTVSCRPAEAVVVAARAGGGCVAACACPHINLFASRAAADRYLATPGLHGTTLTVGEAAAAARRLFGGLAELVAGGGRREGPGVG